MSLRKVTRPQCRPPLLSSPSPVTAFRPFAASLLGVPQIRGSPPPEPFQIGFTHHAPIHHPSRLRFSEALLDHLHHYFHRRHIGPAPVDHFINNERQPPLTHHQRSGLACNQAGDRASSLTRPADFSRTFPRKKSRSCHREVVRSLPETALHSAASNERPKPSEAATLGPATAAAGCRQSAPRQSRANLPEPCYPQTLDHRQLTGGLATCATLPCKPTGHPANLHLAHPQLLPEKTSTPLSKDRAVVELREARVI